MMALGEKLRLTHTSGGSASATSSARRAQADSQLADAQRQINVLTTQRASEESQKLQAQSQLKESAAAFLRQKQATDDSGNKLKAALNEKDDLGEIGRAHV